MLLGVRFQTYTSPWTVEQKAYIILRHTVCIHWEWDTPNVQFCIRNTLVFITFVTMNPELQGQGAWLCLPYISYRQPQEKWSQYIERKYVVWVINNKKVNWLKENSSLQCESTQVCVYSGRALTLRKGNFCISQSLMWGYLLCLTRTLQLVHDNV